MTSPPDFSDINRDFLRWLGDARSPFNPLDAAISELAHCTYGEGPNRLSRVVRMMEQAYRAGRAERETDT